MEDQSGNQSFEVANIRITAIPTTWDDCPGVRIQAYKAEGGLHFGPEIPIHSKAEAYDVVRALLSALDHLNLE